MTDFIVTLLVKENENLKSYPYLIYKILVKKSTYTNIKASELC